MAQKTPASNSRQRRARRARRAPADTTPTTGNRVLDVYGSVTGNGDARSIEGIRASIRDALS